VEHDVAAVPQSQIGVHVDSHSPRIVEGGPGR
jgi:hypothetical protein